jgi:hypothetical protein
MIEFYIPVSARERSDAYIQEIKEYASSNESDTTEMTLMQKAKGSILGDTLITLQKGF